MNTIIKVEDLTKEYHMGEVSVKALRGVNFEIYDGEFVVLLGQSGSGKSTILNIVGGIDHPTGGRVFYQDEDIGGYPRKKLTMYRRNAVGFVFQFYNLIPTLTAWENIELACELSPDPLNAEELLEKIDLLDRKDHFPSQLSGGQQQRIAIARALAKNPGILLCDEPTGALDSETGVQVLEILKEFNVNYKKTVVVITHNAAIGDMADRVLTIRDGLVHRIRENPDPIPAREVEW